MPGSSLGKSFVLRVASKADSCRAEGPNQGVGQPQASSFAHVGRLLRNSAGHLDDAEIAQEHLDDVALFLVADAGHYFHPGHDADERLAVARQLNLHGLGEMSQ